MRSTMPVITLLRSCLVAFPAGRQTDAESNDSLDRFSCLEAWRPTEVVSLGHSRRSKAQFGGNRRSTLQVPTAKTCTWRVRHDHVI